MSEHSTGALLRHEAKKVNRQILKRIQNSGSAGVEHLRNAELKVLSGKRNGKRYNVPGTGRVKYYKRTHTATVTYRSYKASAPGEAPAVRTGVFRTSWQTRVRDLPDGVIMRLYTSQNGKRYPGYLEHGTRKMAPRPYVERIQEMAKPNIVRVLKQL